MKSLYIAICLFMLTTVCIAEETAYFDWRGNQLYASRNYTDALGYFDKAISQEPTYIDAWIHKGDTQKAMKDYNGSIESYSAALKLDENKTVAWSGIVNDYIALKNYANASAAAAKITQVDNKSANWYREGDLLQMQGLYSEAIAKYDGALSLDPKNKNAMYKKGISLMATGNIAQATPLFSQVIEIDPNYKQAYNAQGVALEASGNYIEAQKAYDKALVLDPNNAQFLNNKMHILLALKKQSEAMQIFVKL